MKPVRYYVGNGLYIEDRDPEGKFIEPSWTIYKAPCVYNKKHKEFEWEPSPSNRSKEFLSECRYSLEEAQELVKEILKNESIRSCEE